MIKYAADFRQSQRERDSRVKIFSPRRNRKSSFFGPDVTSNFREGLENKFSQASGSLALPPHPPRVGECVERGTLYAI